MVCGVQDQRVIQLDIAIDTIQLVMSKDMFPLVDLWVTFLKVCPRPLLWFLLVACRLLLFPYIYVLARLRSVGAVSVFSIAFLSATHYLVRAF
jgi:hypothetical protein